MEYWMSVNQDMTYSKHTRTLAYNLFHLLKRRLNRLVIRREAGSIIHTRIPSTLSSSDSEEIGDGSTTLLKEYPVFDPVDRKDQIHSWWKGGEE